jgi:hypothetical protein
MDPFGIAPGPSAAARAPGGQTGKTLESGVAAADKSRGNGVEQVLPDEQTVFPGETDRPHPLDLLCQIESNSWFELGGHGRIAFSGTS